MFFRTPTARLRSDGSVSEDHKIHARLRRERMLNSIKEGYDYTTRIVPSGAIYKRNMKHRPQTPLDWDEVDEWQ